MSRRIATAPVFILLSIGMFMATFNLLSIIFDIGTTKFLDGDSVELVIGVDKGKPNSYASIVDLIGENDGDLVGTVSMGGEIRAVVADIPLAAVSSFVGEVQDAGLSRYIEPNMKFQACFVPADPYWSYQWGPRMIEADYAWNTTFGDSSVLVAVIDTGIDYDHPDLAANYVSLGYDWVNNDTGPMDDEGHGTHCAGIIAAVINNGIGIAGLAQGQIMAEKSLDFEGSGTEDDLANGIIHAVDQGADILVLSWGGYEDSALIHEAVEYAYDHDALVVAAAGNDATSMEFYPAAYDEVIAVTATNQSDNPAWFTNFGDWVELAAPGVDIYSTVWDDTYTYMNGTSMSAPHVVGVAALILSQFPNMTRDQLRLQLRFTSDDLGDPEFDDYYGYGRVNTRRAVEEAPPDHDLLVLDWETPLYVEPGEVSTVDTTVFNFGLSDESDVTVRLLVNGSVVDNATIDSLASGESATVDCSWSPTLEGTYNVTSYVLPVPGETVTENNVVWTFVQVAYLPTPSYYGEWPMFHYGNRNRGYSSFETTVEVLTEAHLIWSYDLPNTVYGSPVVADVDRDGKKEIFIDNGPIGSDSSGGWLYCLNETGQLKWIFNATDTGSRHTTAAIGDVDRNGFNEILYWSRGADRYGIDYPQALYCIEPNGTLRWGYPARYGWTGFSTDPAIPTVADVTGSPQLETVVQNTYNGDLYCISHTGGRLWKYDYAWIHGAPGGLYGTLHEGHVAPAVADLNDDGHSEVVVSIGWYNFTTAHIDQGAILCVDSTGNLLWSKEDIVPVSVTYRYFGSSPVIEDLDGDGILEIVVGSQEIFPGSPGNRTGVWCLNNTGGIVWFFQMTDGVCGTIAVADIDNDATKEIVFGASDNYIYCLNSSGGLEWKYQTGDQVFSSPAIADIEKPPGGESGQQEVVVGSLDGKLYCLNSTGGLLWTFNAGASIYSSPVIADLNYTGEGTPDIIFGASNKLYALRITPAHDLALANITPYKTIIGQGYTLQIDVTIKNKGDYSETFNVTTYEDTTPIQTKTVVDLEPYADTTIAFEWNTTAMPLGNYTLKATAHPLPQEYHTIDNSFIDDTVTVESPLHDIAVIDVVPTHTLIHKGSTIGIAATVANEGNMRETFNVAVYANATEIQTKTVTNIDFGMTQLVAFTWDPTEFALGNYAIKAVASVVPGESQTGDNTYVDGTVTVASPNDIAVTNVVPSHTLINRGNDLNIYVTVKNKGNTMETFNVAVYANATEIQTKTVTNLASGQTKTITFGTNMTSLTPGNYTITATVSILPGESQIWDNTYIDGSVWILEETSVAVHPRISWIQPNQTFTIDVSVHGVIDLRAWQVELHFDPTVLTWISGGSSYGNYILAFDWVPSVNGDLTLVQITFKGKAEGISSLHFSETGTVLYDSDLTVIPFYAVDGTVKVVLHEIATTEITPYDWHCIPGVVHPGSSVSINVTIENKGYFAETFNVTVYANTTAIGTQIVNNLPSGTSTTLTFAWNTTGMTKGSYIISAVADVVPGEVDPADNNLTNGMILVALVGDITGPDGYPDGKCDIRDVALVASKFGAIYPDPRYDPNCDLTGPTLGVPDGKIDIRDVAIVAVHFGDIDP